MTARDELFALLPEGLASAVEQASGATIVGVRPRGGGGASREGAELDLNWPDGRAMSAYMNYDVHRAGAGDDAAFLREAAIIKALSGPLSDAGVRVAPFITAIPEMRALLGGFIAGEPNFYKLDNPEKRLEVGKDFMRQLAKLHKIDVTKTPVENMGPVQPAADLARINIQKLQETNMGANWDPLIQLSIDWLSENIPSDAPAPVIVHGDAGPANFLYADGKVTTLLDWELVHYGDPMADMAMLSLRMLFQPFIPLPDAFAAYEEAGGYPIDLARIRYWRILFQAGFARRSRYDDPDAPPPPNLGMNLVYSTIHRRVLSEALAEAAGIALPPVPLPDAPEGPRKRSFDIALDDIRQMIVPRIADQQAAVKAKGLARLIKWWRDIERFEPGFKIAEQQEIGEALGEEFATPDAAWAAYCAGVRKQTLDQATAIRICNAHVTRDAALMADAMGGLAKTQFAPLE